jgi:hypothetical protein
MAGDDDAIEPVSCYFYESTFVVLQNVQLIKSLQRGGGSSRSSGFELYVSVTIVVLP